MPYNSTNDVHQDTPRGMTNFGRSARIITPSDSTDITPYAKAVCVLSAGNLVVIPTQNADGATVTFTAVPVGLILPYEVRRVLATGTTATVATVDT